MIPENSECYLISDSIPEFYILKMTAPKSLIRFTVRLPKDKFDTLEKIKEAYPVYIHDTGCIDEVESDNDISYTEEESRKIVQKYRSGDSQSKNKGSDFPEPETGELVETTIPISLFDSEHIDYINETTQPERVDRYSKLDIKTPIYITKSEMTKKWVVSDGGHRLMSKIKKGDKNIRALVPKIYLHEIKEFIKKEHTVQAFRKKPLPDFILNEWYIIENYKHPLIRFDGYDNGLYKASIPSKSNNGIIKVNIDENIFRKYDVRPATSDELYKLCPNKQFSLIKTLNTSVPVEKL
jgi:hypothetical protein